MSPRPTPPHPPHPADAHIGPELELALSWLGEHLDIDQDDLPLGLERMLQAFGRACFDRGDTYAHEKDTLVLNPRSSQAGSGVYPEIADAIADELDEPPDETNQDR